MVKFCFLLTMNATGRLTKDRYATVLIRASVHFICYLGELNANQSTGNDSNEIQLLSRETLRKLTHKNKL